MAENRREEAGGVGVPEQKKASAKGGEHNTIKPVARNTPPLLQKADTSETTNQTQ